MTRMTQIVISMKKHCLETPDSTGGTSSRDAMYVPLYSSLLPTSFYDVKLTCFDRVEKQLLCSDCVSVKKEAW